MLDGLHTYTAITIRHGTNEALKTFTFWKTI